MGACVFRGFKLFVTDHAFMLPCLLWGSAEGNVLYLPYSFKKTRVCVYVCACVCVWVWYLKLQNVMLVISQFSSTEQKGWIKINKAQCSLCTLWTLFLFAIFNAVNFHMTVFCFALEDKKSTITINYSLEWGNLTLWKNCLSVQNSTMMIAGGCQVLLCGC